jgi:hypothetical protein
MSTKAIPPPQEDFPSPGHSDLNTLQKSTANTSSTPTFQKSKVPQIQGAKGVVPPTAGSYRPPTFGNEGDEGLSAFIAHQAAFRLSYISDRAKNLLRVERGVCPK